MFNNFLKNNENRPPKQSKWVQKQSNLAKNNLNLSKNNLAKNNFNLSKNNLVGQIKIVFCQI